MGTFVTASATPTIFPDGAKSAAPGVRAAAGWTSDNYLAASEINAIHDALFDCRTGIRAGPGGQSVMGRVCYSSDVEYVSGVSSPATQALAAGSVNELVQFGEVLVSEGSVFDEDPTEFLVTTPGIYLLQTNLSFLKANTATSSFIRAHFLGSVGGVFARATAQHETATNRFINISLQTVVQLSANEVVTVLIGATGADYELLGGLYSTFSGTLLKVT